MSSHESDKYIEHDEKGEVSHLEKLDNRSVGDVVEVIKAHNVHFAEAAAAGKLNPRSRDSFVLYGCCFVAVLCACANGYDGSLMTGINIMPFYQRRFTDSTLGPTTGLIFSMYTIGQISGPWFAGPIADYFGRRVGMFVGCIFVIVGSIVIATAPHRPQFLAGRFILGFGVSIAVAAAPTYAVEITPPMWRGRMTGLYNCGWYLGSIPAAGVVLGAQKMQSDWSWRLPLLLQCVPSTIVVLTVLWLPESPRWLMSHGRETEALAFLARFHGNGDPQNPIVQLEWKEFNDSIRLDASDKRWWDYKDLFSTSSARWRSLQVILMGVFGQFSGNGLGYFNTQIYAAVGYDSYMQFVLNLAHSLVTAVCGVTGAANDDRLPRRPTLIFASMGCGAMLGLNAGLSKLWAEQPAGHKNLNVGRAAVASYFLFSVSFAIGYTPLQALYPVECLETTTRAKGMAMNGFITGAISFINLYCTPIALKNIQYYYTFIFFGWDFIEAFIWWLFAVETQGRTLEELEEIFAASFPPRASTKLIRVGVKKEGGVEVIGEV